MADNPLLDLYAVPKGGGSPLLGLYSSQGQQPQADLGDKPVPKQPLPSEWQDQPRPHGVPQVTVAKPQEGVTPKEGQTVQPTDIPAQMVKGKEALVQTAAEATGVADIRSIYSGEKPWTDVVPGMMMMAVGGPEAKGAEKGVLEGAKAVKNILSPSSTALGKEAALGLRKATGEAARTTEQTRAALIPYEQKIATMLPEQRLDLLGYMEGRSKGKTIPDPDLQEYADEFRNQMESRKERIKLLGIEAGVVEDYVTHFWADRSAARSFVNSWMSKQGSGRSLKARTLPTIEEGIKAGLKPISDNPNEIAMRYVKSMDLHLGLREFIDAGEQAGQVRHIADQRDIPEGWIQLKGMVDRQGLYAPADWARIWNNFVAKGVYENADVGDAYRSFRNLSNLTTQTILSFSGYHAVAMAKEAIASDLVKGIGQVVGGLRRGEASRVLRGGGTIAKAATGVVPPVQKYRTGKKFAEVYLGRTPNSIDPRELPNWEKMASVFAEAGGRGAGKEHALDYSFTPAGSFSTAWKRGWLKAEKAQAPGTFTSAFREAAQKVIQAGGNRNAAAKAGAKAMQTARSTAEIISRTMSTIMAPLFEKYIPMLKNGAFADEMRSWMELNPNASHEEQVAYAAKLIDSIDNRFGEMIQDNIMWHTSLKQAATIGMLSYSWNLGSLRLVVGGGKDILATAGKTFDPTSKSYSPNAAWVVVYPMAVAIAAAMYQYAKTGKPPEKAADLIWPQTGGTAPGFGHKGTTPETAILPGYEKEPGGWWYNGISEVVNKANPFIRMGIQAMMNSDWRGDPIRRPDPTVPEWLADTFNYILHSMIPITLGRIGQGEKPGSAMGLGEELTGIRPGPLYEQDPEGYRRGMSAMETTKWIRKLDHDYKAGIITLEEKNRRVRAARDRQMQYGGPQQ